MRMKGKRDELLSTYFFSDVGLQSPEPRQSSIASDPIAASHTAYQLSIRFAILIVETDPTVVAAEVMRAPHTPVSHCFRFLKRDGQRSRLRLEVFCF